MKIIERMEKLMDNKKLYFHKKKRKTRQNRCFHQFIGAIAAGQQKHDHEL